MDSNFWKRHWLSSFLRSLLLRITQFRLGYEPAAGKRSIWGLISFIDYFPVQILQGTSSPWDGYPCVRKPEINKSIQKKTNFILLLNQKLRYTHFSLPSPPWLKYILCYISNCFEPTLGHSQRHDSNNTLSVKQSKTVSRPCWVCIYTLKWADSLIIHPDLVIVCLATAVTTGARVSSPFMAPRFLPRVCLQIPLLPFSGCFAGPSPALPRFNFIIASEAIQGWLILDETTLHLKHWVFFTRWCSSPQHMKPVYPSTLAMLFLPGPFSIFLDISSDHLS